MLFCREIQFVAIYALIDSFLRIAAFLDSSASSAGLDHNDFSVKGLLLMMLFLCSLPVAYVVVGLKPSWQVFSHRLYPTFNQCTMRT